jgi:hypothetical protein
MNWAGLSRQKLSLTEGYHHLAPVFYWFTEGFDMADLKDAKAL